MLNPKTRPTPPSEQTPMPDIRTPSDPLWSNLKPNSNPRFKGDCTIDDAVYEDCILGLVRLLIDWKIRDARKAGKSKADTQRLIDQTIKDQSPYLYPRQVELAELHAYYRMREMWLS